MPLSCSSPQSCKSKAADMRRRVDSEMRTVPGGDLFLFADRPPHLLQRHLRELAEFRQLGLLLGASSGSLSEVRSSARLVRLSTRTSPLR